MPYRADIDGLRAVAVLAVLAFHAFPGLFPSGFIGVDVFFVISGFLITGIIVEALEAGSFSFSEFYARRIRRIFPALSLVLLLTKLAGWALLYREDYVRVGQEVMAGAGFWANFLFWSEAGYFDTNSLDKPLLHLWSLAVEEQFYLLWPPLLLLAWKRSNRLGHLFWALFSLSFICSCYLLSISQSAAFYLPWSRFWELIAGAMTWQAMRHRILAPTWRQMTGLAGGFALMLGFVSIEADHFPGAWALLPVLGAAALIAAGPESWTGRILGCKPAVMIGKISYPLYLWHWPLLIMPMLASGNMLTRSAKIALLASAFFLSWLTYVGLEKRLRHAHAGRRLTLLLCTVMLLFAGMGFCMSRGALFSLTGKYIVQIPDNEIAQARLVGESGDESHFSERARRVVIYGDSQAGDIFKALHVDDKLGVKIFRMSYVCSTFFISGESSTGSCRDDYERMLGSPELRRADVLIYSHQWRADPDSVEHDRQALQDIRHANPGIKVMYFGYKPYLGSSWVSIHKIMRAYDGKEDINAYLSKRAQLQGDDRESERRAKMLGVIHVPVARIFCANDHCPFYQDGKYSYIDQNHWTLDGARFFHEKLVKTPYYAELIGQSAGQADEQEFQ